MNNKEIISPILELGPDFYDKVKPAAFPEFIERFSNPAAFKQIDLDSYDLEFLKRHFWSFESLPNNLPSPLALRYHGHQFRNYNPQIGDGRGFLFAQFKTKDERLLDLGTKGSGQTPWSRTGDGRLTLKGAVREALATTRLEALGVNTSKTLCFIETSEELERNDEPSPTRSAVLTRLCHGHIRIGTFQRTLYFQKPKDTEKLLDYCILHFYPYISEVDLSTKCLRFLKEVLKATSQTCAQWVTAGFVHGVLNTDNINITGESFDYGPYRFIPRWDPEFTAAYFDQGGLYSFDRQPESILWNLCRLAETLLPLGLNLEKANQVLGDFWTIYEDSLEKSILRRLDLAPSKEFKLSPSLKSFMIKSKVPFDQFFFDWTGGVSRQSHALKGPAKDYYRGIEFDELMRELSKFTPLNSTYGTHSYFQNDLPLTLDINQINQDIWEPISTDNNWHPFNDSIQEHLKLPQPLNLSHNGTL